MFIGKEGGIEIIHNLIKTNLDEKVSMFSTIEYTDYTAIPQSMIGVINMGRGHFAT